MSKEEFLSSFDPNPTNDPVPPYEENISPNNGRLTSDIEKPVISRGESLASTLAQVQQERVLQLIESTIEPLLVGHAQSGLFKRIFALIPSDSSSLEGNESLYGRQCGSERIVESEVGLSDEVVGFSDFEGVTVVRLHGPGNNVHFWKQPDVIQDLDAQLRIRLGIPREPVQQIDVAPEITPPPKRKSFLTRKSSASQGNSKKPPLDTAKPRQPVAPRPGDVALRVTVEEIWLRRLSEMGLFETRPCQAVLIRVHIG